MKSADIRVERMVSGPEVRIALIDDFREADSETQRLEHDPGRKPSGYPQPFLFRRAEVDIPFLRFEPGTIFPL